MANVARGHQGISRTASTEFIYQSATPKIKRGAIQFNNHRWRSVMERRSLKKLLLQLHLFLTIPMPFDMAA